jgi:hypothetical protein
MWTEAEISARIEAIKNTDLPAIRAAISNLIAGKHSEYWLDTGPSNQKVKRISLADLQAREKALQEELARLYRESGMSGTIGQPCW